MSERAGLKRHKEKGNTSHRKRSDCAISIRSASILPGRIKSAFFRLRTRHSRPCFFPHSEPLLQPLWQSGCKRKCIYFMPLNQTNCQVSSFSVDCIECDDNEDA